MSDPSTVMTDTPTQRRQLLKAGAALLAASAAVACTQQAATPTAGTSPTSRPANSNSSSDSDSANGSMMGGEGSSGAGPSGSYTGSGESGAPAELAPETPVDDFIGELPPLGVLVYNRLAFGPRPGDLEAFDALPGATPADKLAAWLDAQLDPSALDDSALEGRLALLRYDTLTKDQATAWQQHVVEVDWDNDDDAWSKFVRPAEEARNATFLRALYSERQLFEVLADFWHNHFNVYLYQDSGAALFGVYDRDVIRANALGNFRDMVLAVAKSPIMLYYLDNYNNQVTGPNENWARELFELHTLGAENYLGVLPPTEVEGFAAAQSVGYVDNDVYEAARAFTGWRVADNYEDDDWQAEVPGDGNFFFYRAWHDRFNKIILGNYLPSDQADTQDGEQVIELLIRHPGTARFIARKLARRLIADNPPEAVVEAAAAEFAAHIDAPDQIARTVRVIVTSPEFAGTWGAKVKRPFEFTMSLMRAINADFTQWSDGFSWMYQRMGQPLFEHMPPNGYPDVRPAWTSTVSLVNRWQMTTMIVENWIEDEGGVKPVEFDLLAQTPDDIRSGNALARYWADRILGRPLMDTSAYDRLGAFMAGEGYGPDDDIDDDEYLRWRLPGLVELVLMSPDFMMR